MKKTKDVRWLTGVAMMAAIVVLLANTPLGMIQLPIIKATTVHIPVIVGAIMFGPKAGAILGGVFGICSVISNTMTPTVLSFCFSPFMSNDGFVGAAKALWISVGCRILIGVVSGWVWIGLKKLRASDFIALPVVGFLGSMTNSVTVVGSIALLLRSEYNVAYTGAQEQALAAGEAFTMKTLYDFVIGTVTYTGVLEAVVALVLVTVIGKALLKVFQR